MYYELEKIMSLKWHSVKDELPDKEDSYITYIEYEEEGEKKQIIEINLFLKDKGFVDCLWHEMKVTHWMPMPISPVEAKNELIPDQVQHPDDWKPNRKEFNCE